MENTCHNKLLLLGNGGHCKSILDCVISSGQYTEIGIVGQDVSCSDSEYFVGTDDDLPKLFNTGWKNAFISVGSIGNTKVREKLYRLLSDIGFYMPSIIDPSAVIAKNVRISDGVFIGKKAVVNSGTFIDSCAIINTGSIIEHDCIIGKFVHISPGSTLCGDVHIGDRTHIGAGTVIRQQIKIGENSLIGMGSIVVNNIPDNVVAFGNPCRVK